MVEPTLLIDLGIGNIGSVANMIRRAGGVPVLVSTPGSLFGARKVILPGVGSFDAMVDKLDAAGFRQPILEYASGGGSILGVCLGMQLLASSSEEGGREGLGLIPGHVRRFCFDASQSNLKVPHMGWNKARPAKTHLLSKELEDDSRFYFVHSYYYECIHSEDVLFETSYGINFASGVQRGNVMGVQFHPEKSHRYGMQLLKNFIEL